MWLYRLTRPVGNVFARPYWRLGIRGAVEAIPLEGPLIVASNHASLLDPWLLGLAFPRHVRYLIARDWYDRSPLWRAFFRATGTIPVAPHDPEATIAVACAALARGQVVGIFPEGAISPDGRLRRFRRGVSMIAARSGAPVLPVGLRGNFDALPRHGRLPRPRRVTVWVGAPLRFPGAPVRGAIPREVAARFLGQLRGEIARLAGQDSGCVRKAAHD